MEFPKSELMAAAALRENLAFVDYIRARIFPESGAA
jgi:hypothetical protein